MLKGSQRLKDLIRYQMLSKVLGEKYMMEKFRFWTGMDVRWGDEDSYGHVNNAVYLSYFEQGRAAFFGKIGLHLDKAREAGAGPVVAHLDCTYKQSLTYPALIRVGIRTLEVGTRSFKLGQVLCREGETQPAAFGDVVCVWFDYHNQVTAPVPSELREHLLAWRDSEGHL